MTTSPNWGERKTFNGENTGVEHPGHEREPQESPRNNLSLRRFCVYVYPTYRFWKEQEQQRSSSSTSLSVHHFRRIHFSDRLATFFCNIWQTSRSYCSALAGTSGRFAPRGASTARTSSTSARALAAARSIRCSTKIYEIGATSPWATGVSALAGNSG